MPPSSEQDNPRLERSAARSVAPGFDLSLAADWISPSVARDRVRAWLRGHRWSPSHTEDLVLAVNEAVSNSIEHGYGLIPELDLADAEQVVEVSARLVLTGDGTRRAEFTIRDHGRWQTPENSTTTRGHGLRIMRACAEDVHIDHGSVGTTVVLHSRSVPPPLRSVRLAGQVRYTGSVAAEFEKNDGTGGSSPTGLASRRFG